MKYNFFDILMTGKFNKGFVIAPSGASIPFMSTKNKKLAGNMNSTFVKSDNSIHYHQYFLAVSLLLFFMVYFFNPKKILIFNNKDFKPLSNVFLTEL